MLEYLLETNKSGALFGEFVGPIAAGILGIVSLQFFGVYVCNCFRPDLMDVNEKKWHSISVGFVFGLVCIYFIVTSYYCTKTFPYLK